MADSETRGDIENICNYYKELLKQIEGMEAELWKTAGKSAHLANLTKLHRKMCT